MYAILNMNYKPFEWLEMSQKQKAFVIACIDIKIKEEKKASKKK